MEPELAGLERPGQLLPMQALGLLIHYSSHSGPTIANCPFSCLWSWSGGFLSASLSGSGDLCGKPSAWSDTKHLVFFRPSCQRLAFESQSAQNRRKSRSRTCCRHTYIHHRSTEAECCYTRSRTFVSSYDQRALCASILSLDLPLSLSGAV